MVSFWLMAFFYLHQLNESAGLLLLKESLAVVGVYRVLSSTWTDDDYFRFIPEASGCPNSEYQCSEKTSKRYNFFPSEMSSGYQGSCEELLCVQSSFHSILAITHTSELR
jgi:hypothetical protein